MPRSHPCAAILTALTLCLAPAAVMAAAVRVEPHTASKPAPPVGTPRAAPRRAQAAAPMVHNSATHAYNPPMPRRATAQSRIAPIAVAAPRAGATAVVASVGAQGWNRGWHGESRYDWAAWRASHREVYRLGYYYPPVGDYAYAPIASGGLIDTAFMDEQFWIADPSIYHLPPVWGPYRWVRYYNDALLVDIDTGQVVDVVRAIFL